MTAKNLSKICKTQCYTTQRRVWTHCVLAAFTQGNDCCALASDFRNVVHISKIVFEVLPLWQTIQTLSSLWVQMCVWAFETGHSYGDRAVRAWCQTQAQVSGCTLKNYALRCVIWLYATEKDVPVWPSVCVLMLWNSDYSDTSANEDNSFRNHIR